jgi:hypothetical protein
MKRIQAAQGFSATAECGSSIEILEEEGQVDP